MSGRNGTHRYQRRVHSYVRMKECYFEIGTLQLQAYIWCGKIKYLNQMVSEKESLSLLKIQLLTEQGSGRYILWGIGLWRIDVDSG